MIKMNLAVFMGMTTILCIVTSLPGLALASPPPASDCFIDSSWKSTLVGSTQTRLPPSGVMDVLMESSKRTWPTKMGRPCVGSSTLSSGDGRFSVEGLHGLGDDLEAALFELFLGQRQERLDDPMILLAGFALGNQLDLDGKDAVLEGTVELVGLGHDFPFSSAVLAASSLALTFLDAFGPPLAATMASWIDVQSPMNHSANGGLTTILAFPPFLAPGELT